MATTTRVYIPSVYVDRVRFTEAADEQPVALINTLPESGEEAANPFNPVQLTIAALDTGLDALTKVWIDTPTGGRVLVYDQAGAGLSAAYAAGSSATYQQSPSAATQDELVLSLYPAGGFPEGEPVTVTLEAYDTNGFFFTASYAFATATTSPPVVEEIFWLTPRRCRVKFRDAMVATAAIDGTLYNVNLAGALEFESPDQIKLTNVLPDPDWVGLYAAFTGSVHPYNNGVFRITAVDVPNRKITVDNIKPFKSDDGVDRWRDGNIARQRKLRGRLTPFRLQADIPTEQPGVDLLCAYVPTPETTRLPEAWELPEGADATRYVIIDWHDDVSYGRPYTLAVIGPENLSGVAADGAESLSFTTPTFGRPDTRLKLWDDLWQEDDRLEDAAEARLLERMSLVLQDLFDVLWWRSDRLIEFWDGDVAQEQMLPFLLYTLGNPFRFPLTTAQQRALVTNLTTLYKRAGTNKGIEEALTLLLGKDYTVRGLQFGFPWWELDADRLGFDTILSPGSDYEKNCYEVVAHLPLDDGENRYITEIATTLDAPEMHLVRIVEPSSHVIESLYWVLDWSQLGTNTQLAWL
jgi:phage tail-like protein